MTKKRTLRLLSAMAALLTFTTTMLGQTEVVIGNDMDFIDTSSRTDFRSSSAGDIAVVLNSTINSDFFFEGLGTPILNHEESTIDDWVDQISPSFRYYLTSRQSVNAGILLSRQNQNVAGATTDTSDFEYSNIAHTFKSNSISLRVGYEQWNQPIYFRKFNLDTYFGASVRLGRLVTTEEQNYDYVSGDYDYTTISTPSGVFGGELYTGLAMRFDAFSFGVELLGIGFERQSGFGISDVSYANEFDGETDAGSYLVSSADLPSEFATYQYTELSAKSSKTSMYRGIRVLAVLHIN